MKTRLLGRRFFLSFYAILLSGFLLVPLLIIVPLSFTDAQSFAFPPTGWSTRWYERFFADPLWWRSLINSAQIAAQVMLLATALGTMAAIGLSRRRSRLAGLLNGFLLAPQIIPVVVLAFGIFAVFLQWRLQGTVAGFVLAHTVLAIPLVLIPILARLRSFDRNMERAAASLGASGFTTFRLVTIPLIAPGIFTGMIFAFAISFDETVIALFLSSARLRTLPVRMYESVTVEVDPTIAAASTLILLVTFILLAISQLVQKRRRV